MKKIDFLRKVPFFNRLPAEDLESLATLVKRKKFARDEVIIHKDEPGGALYIIIEGKVKVLLPAIAEQKTEMAMLGDGDFFGEMSLFGEFERSADVVAAEEVQLAVINKKDFINLIKKNPNISISLLREMSYRLKQANEKAERHAAVR